MNVYVATSWRNPYTDVVIETLRERGHDVYDFRASAFRWRDVADELLPAEVAAALADDANDEAAPLLLPAPMHRRFIDDRRAQAHFQLDMQGLEGADALVLILPCGRSAHTELGWALARGLTTIVLMPMPEVPELLYSDVDLITDDLTAVVLELEGGVIESRTGAME